MDLNIAKLKIQKLKDEIARHEHLYRKENKPEISDEDFDELLKELKLLEEEFPQLKSLNSPTQKIGSDLSEAFEKEKHSVPMQSLDNVFNTQELSDFDKRLKKIIDAQDKELQYCIEPKIDGLGISAIYENGKLVKLLTRGDGEVADNITRNAPLIKNLPNIIKSAPKHLEVRGEVYMENDEFERINQNLENQGLTTYANPRNLAAGTLKLISINQETLNSRSLKVCFYNLVSGENLTKQSDLKALLKNWGLPYVDYLGIATGIEQVFEEITQLELQRSNFKYNIDGAVIKLNDTKFYEQAGSTQKAPRWATAWKYKAQQIRTLLKSITLQVGRTGIITPVGELEEVFLSGSLVSRATLHNAGNIATKDIREGDMVLIEKAGEIIPAILKSFPEERDENSKEYLFPEKCPECGSTLKPFGQKMLYRCPNLSCPPQITGRIAHFASKQCMDISGLGIANVQKLVSELNIKEPSQLYDENILNLQNLENIEKFGTKSANNLLKSLKQSKEQDLWRLIFALGILEIGEQFAKDLAKTFKNLNTLKNATIEELTNIDGFGLKSKNENSVRANSVRTFFDDEHNLEIVNNLEKAGLNFDYTPSNKINTLLEGKIFVITGTLQTMDRTKAKTTLESLGAKVNSSVSQNTNFLINASNDDSSSKAKNAKKFGTKILNEQEFLNMIDYKNQSENSSQLELF